LPARTGDHAGPPLQGMPLGSNRLLASLDNLAGSGLKMNINTAEPRWIYH
jgi:hypothetical protein